MEFQNIQLAILIISIFLPPYLIFSSSIIKDGLKAQLFHGLKNYLIFPVPADSGSTPAVSETPRLPPHSPVGIPQKPYRYCLNAPLKKRGDGLLGGVAGGVLDEGEHRPLFAVGAAELEVYARSEHVPGVADNAVGALPLADESGKLDILGAAGHDVAADDEASGRKLFAL